jgi:ParB-like chromosome segregation protein Spo0J
LKYLQKIPLDKIILAKHVARMTNVTDVPADLKLSIQAHGLTNPIIVSPNSENEFEIIDGQKRKVAYEILNKSHPEGKFDVIDCLVCEKHDENMQLAISLAAHLHTYSIYRNILTENLSQAWGKYNDFNAIKDRYGISERTVKKYVKYGRLPTLIQDKINDKKITLRTSLAVVDAMSETYYNSEGIRSDSDLLEIIVELEKLKSNERIYKKFIKLLGNDPSIKSYDDIIRHHENSFREMKISIPEIMGDIIQSNFSVHPHTTDGDSFRLVEKELPPMRVRSFSESDMNIFILQSIVKYFDSYGIDYDEEKIEKMLDMVNEHGRIRYIR